jgi:hypothetical protein
MSTTTAAPQPEPQPAPQPALKAENIMKLTRSRVSEPVHDCSSVMVMVLAVSIVLILLIMVSLCSRTRHRLARRGWVLYTLTGCGYCTQQLDLLGGQYSKTVKCNSREKQIGGYTHTPPIPCNSPMINGYPFWYNARTHQSRSGVQDTAALDQMARR